MRVRIQDRGQDRVDRVRAKGKDLKVFKFCAKNYLPTEKKTKDRDNKNKDRSKDTDTDIDANSRNMWTRTRTRTKTAKIKYVHGFVDSSSSWMAMESRIDVKKK